LQVTVWDCPHQHGATHHAYGGHDKSRDRTVRRDRGGGARGAGGAAASPRRTRALGWTDGTTYRGDSALVVCLILAEPPAVWFRSGAVERRRGPPHQFRWIHRGGPEIRYAREPAEQLERVGLRLPGRVLGSLDGIPEALAKGACLLRIRVDRHNNESAAVQPPDRIRRPRARAECGGHLLQELLLLAVAVDPV